MEQGGVAERDRAAGKGVTGRWGVRRGVGDGQRSEETAGSCAGSAGRNSSGEEAVRGTEGKG